MITSGETDKPKAENSTVCVRQKEESGLWTIWIQRPLCMRPGRRNGRAGRRLPAAMTTGGTGKGGSLWNKNKNWPASLQPQPHLTGGAECPSPRFARIERWFFYFTARTKATPGSENYVHKSAADGGSTTDLLLVLALCSSIQQQPVRLWQR